MCGSAARSLGTQPLLDAVVDYLPSPADRRHPFESYFVAGTNDQTPPLVALAFKTEHDTRYGQLTYVRLYRYS
jgi:elongation factor G